MNFKLVITNISSDPQLFAEAVVENYGENYDAAQGDFAVYVVPDTDAPGKSKVEVLVNDVAKGDMKMLREDIYRDFGDEDDSLWISCSEQIDGGWFSVDLDEDE